MKDYRNSGRIGIATSSHEGLKPIAQAFAEALESAIPHAEALGCYVEGELFAPKLRRIIAHLQHAGMVTFETADLELLRQSAKTAETAGNMALAYTLHEKANQA